LKSATERLRGLAPSAPPARSPGEDEGEEEESLDHGKDPGIENPVSLMNDTTIDPTPDGSVEEYDNFIEGGA
jgi:hypothetical protein